MPKCHSCRYWPKCEEFPWDESGCNDFELLIRCEKCRHHFNVDGDDICRRPGLNGEMIVAPDGFCAWGESKNGSI